MSKQILHLVFGGELTALDRIEFRDLKDIHYVGLFPNFSKAREAWKSAAQASVDNAHMRYFVVHLHKLLQPEIVLASPLAKRDKGGRGAPKAGNSTGKARKAGPRK